MGFWEIMLALGLLFADIGDQIEETETQMVESKE
jgi:hypothetical protein